VTISSVTAAVSTGTPTESTGPPSQRSFWGLEAPCSLRMPRCSRSPLTTGPLGGADLSIPAGMIVGGFVYYAFNRLASGAALTEASAPALERDQEGDLKLDPGNLV